MTLKTVLATAALLMASAAYVAPAVADEDDNAPTTRVQRNWTGGSSSTGQRATATRGTSSGHVTHSAGTSRPAAAASTYDDDADGVRVTTSRGLGGGSYRDRDSQFELDPGEAARIRQAHRETDQHVTLRRDDDYGDTPVYYTPPARHWYSWW